MEPLEREWMDLGPGELGQAVEVQRADDQVVGVQVVGV